MSLLPSLKQIAPGLNAIFNQIHLDSNAPKDLIKAQSLIQEAIDCYDAIDLSGNDTTIKNLNQVYKLLGDLKMQTQDQELPELYLLHGYNYALISAIFLYRGEWSQAFKTIKEAQSAALQLTKKEKSARNLFFQAEIKAMTAQIQLCLEQFDKGLAMFSSSLRLYKQALKKEDKSLQEQIVESLQRKSFKLAEIYMNLGQNEPSLEYYELSYAAGKSSQNKNGSLYALLCQISPEKKELLKSLLDLDEKQLFEKVKQQKEPKKEDKNNDAALDNPQKDEEQKEQSKPIEEEIDQEDLQLDLKSESDSKAKTDTQTSKESPQEMAARIQMELMLLVGRIKAVLLFQDPGFFEVEAFFADLFFVLECFYQSREFTDNAKLKAWSEKLDDQALLSLCTLLKDYVHSELYVSLLKKDYNKSDDPDESLGDLSRQEKSFSHLGQLIEKKQKIEDENPFLLVSNPKERVLYRLFNFYEDKAENPKTEEDGTFDPKEVEKDQIYGYLYGVALIISCTDLRDLQTCQHKLFNFCLRTGARLYEEEEYPQALFYDEHVLEGLQMHDPFDLLPTYEDQIDFYTEIGTLYNMAGEGKNCRKYLKKADQLQDEMYSQDYDDDDYDDYDDDDDDDDILFR